MNQEFFVEEGKTSSDRVIHTPSSFARKHLSFVQEVGELTSLKPHSCIRENLKSYLFFVVKEGKGSVTTGGKVYEVKKGDCVFIDCVKHYEHLSSAENPWTIAWVHFYGELPKQLYALYLEGSGNSPVFTPEETDSYAAILQELKSLEEKNTVMSEMQSSHKISTLLMKILSFVVGEKELSVDHEDAEEEDLFENLREAVNEHCAEHGLLGTLAVQYGTHPEKLNEVFEGKYGITLSDYIVNRRYNNAKEALRFTIKPVEEVIAEAGFSSADQFVSMLDGQEHMSPEEYRKKWAQWVKS
ncbi:MAG: AraC family transcriptional regulator [Lachnospiraceae bacterium]|nr:AraC family transcriptional regulator [Lachnospiraceae bacterium]